MKVWEDTSIMRNNQQIDPRPLSTTLVYEAQGCLLPAERDSVLLLDPDLDDNLESSEPGRADVF